MLRLQTAVSNDASHQGPSSTPFLSSASAAKKALGKGEVKQGDMSQYGPLFNIARPILKTREAQAFAQPGTYRISKLDRGTVQGLTLKVGSETILAAAGAKSPETAADEINYHVTENIDRAKQDDAKAYVKFLLGGLIICPNEKLKDAAYKVHKELENRYGW